MKFKINAQKIRQSLAPFANTNFPWLLIKYEDEQITFYSKDEIAFEIFVEIEWVDYGDIREKTYINNLLFCNILKGHKECDIEILDDKLILSSESKIDTITFLNDIPLKEVDMDSIDRGNKICLLKSDFELIRNATKFVSNTMDCVNSLRYIEITSTSSYLMAIASDGKRCYCCEFSTIESSYSYFLADKNLILLVDKMIRKLPSDTLFSIYIGEAAIVIEVDNTLILSTFPTIQYPNVQGLYPKSWEFSYKVNNRDLLSAVRECQSIDIGRKHDKITLTFSGNKLEISSKIPEIGISTRIIDIEGEGGETLSITLPTRYLIESIEDVIGKLSISINDSHQPIMLSGNNSDRLLMPLIK